MKGKQIEHNVVNSTGSGYEYMTERDKILHVTASFARELSLHAHMLPLHLSGTKGSSLLAQKQLETETLPTNPETNTLKLLTHTQKSSFLRH